MEAHSAFPKPAVPPYPLRAMQAAAVAPHTLHLPLRVLLVLVLQRPMGTQEVALTCLQLALLGMQLRPSLALLLTAVAPAVALIPSLPFSRTAGEEAAPSTARPPPQPISRQGLLPRQQRPPW